MTPKTDRFRCWLSRAWAARPSSTSPKTRTRQVRRASAGHHSGRHGWQRLCGAERARKWRQGHRLRHTNAHGRHAGDSDARRAATGRCTAPARLLTESEPLDLSPMNCEALLVDFFIHRPVFATVCALLIILAGAVVIPTLPISLYPQLAPPQVTVTSDYIGANSSQVESAVTIPLEEAINGVPGMRYIQSTSANDGTSAITTTFNTGYNLDIAAVDVQNRVSSAAGPAARRSESDGHHRQQGEQQFRLRRRHLCRARAVQQSVHEQLPRRLHQGRAQARAGRRRRVRFSASASMPCASGWTRSSWPHASSPRPM